MQITRKSVLTGKVATLDVPCTARELAAYEAGMLIQDAMPNVPPDMREFLMSGITPDEWQATFGEQA